MNNIGIIGAGTMGKAIAIEYARYGHNVTLLSAQRHLDSLSLNAEIQRLITKIDPTKVDQITSFIKLTNDFRDLSDCPFIIEAVSESLEKKRKAVAEAIKYAPIGAIFASNTSSLSTEKILGDLVGFDRVCGLHFFNPVHIMKLVELSYLPQTGSTTIEYAKQLALSIEKEVILIKNSPGFIVNRLLIPMINEAIKIFETGLASATDVDRAMKFGANHPIGPLKLSDLIGNDVVLNILKSFDDSADIEISPLLIKMVEQGKLGRKTKEGFFTYDK